MCHREGSRTGINVSGGLKLDVYDLAAMGIFLPIHLSCKLRLKKCYTLFLISTESASNDQQSSGHASLPKQLVWAASREVIDNQGLQL